MAAPPPEGALPMPSTATDRRARPTDMQDACYRCRWRRELPGDAHSSCRHPLTEEWHKNPLAPLIEATGGALPLSIDGLVVEGHPHGVAMSWFAWPFNFDPTWLLRCDGFERL